MFTLPSRHALNGADRASATLQPLDAHDQMEAMGWGTVAVFAALQAQLDPFALAEAIDQQLARLYALAHHRTAARPPAPAPAAHRLRDTRRLAASRPAASRVPAPVSRHGRVTSHMARRSGGK